MKFKILIATQSNESFFEDLDNKYFPITVGAKNLNTDFPSNYLKDSDGINISDKNSMYCEMTGVYWLWKNDLDSEIIGLNHYRRFFALHNRNRFRHYFTPIFKIDQKIIQEINFDNEGCIDILSNHDIILPNPRVLENSIYNEYINDKHHIKTDIDNLIEILVKSGENISDVNNIFHGNILFHYNMFITKKEIFKQYAGWLFPILEKLEETIDLQNRSKQQSRVLGYISERLLTYYCLSRELVIYNSPVLWINSEYKLFKYLKPKQSSITNLLNFTLLKIHRYIKKS